MRHPRPARIPQILLLRHHVGHRARLRRRQLLPGDRGLQGHFFATALGVALPAIAQHKANNDDMEVPTNDMKVVETGKAWFARRCSFCHGSDGQHHEEGAGPCQWPDPTKAYIQEAVGRCQ